MGGASTQLNYTLAERATHSSDMRDSVRAARAEVAGGRVRDETRWRLETSTYAEAGRRVLANFEKDPTEYVFNYRAEQLPAARPVVIDAFGRVTRVIFDDHFHRTAEMPVHAALAGKTAWDLGTQTSESERAGFAAAKLARAREAVSKANSKLLDGAATPYEGLCARETRRTDVLRASRRAEFVAATDAGAVADKMANEKRWTGNFRDSVSRRERFVPASRDALRAPATALERFYVQVVADDAAASAARAGGTRHSPPRKIVQTRSHSGVFATSRAALAMSAASETADAAEWSCCGAEREDAPGCVVKQTDKMHWGYGAL